MISTPVATMIDGLEVLDFGLGRTLLDYESAWASQQRLHAEVVAGHRGDTVLLVEHEPVYTAGTSTQPADRPFDGSPVLDVDRGGRITWHGPGQAVVYPILRLPDPLDVVAHVRRLEDFGIAICAAAGVPADRVPGRSGVWVGGNRKVAAVGVRVARGVTMHGIAINADCDLSWYDRIVPCGIRDAGVTSLTAESGGRIGVADLLEPILAHLRRVRP